MIQSGEGSVTKDLHVQISDEAENEEDEENIEVGGQQIRDIFRQSKGRKQWREDLLDSPFDLLDDSMKVSNKILLQDEPAPIPFEPACSFTPSFFSLSPTPEIKAERNDPSQWMTSFSMHPSGSQLMGSFPLYARHNLINVTSHGQLSSQHASSSMLNQNPSENLQKSTKAPQLSPLAAAQSSPFPSSPADRRSTLSFGNPSLSERRTMIGPVFIQEADNLLEESENESRARSSDILENVAEEGSKRIEGNENNALASRMTIDGENSVDFSGTEVFGGIDQKPQGLAMMMMRMEECDELSGIVDDVGGDMTDGEDEEQSSKKKDGKEDKEEEDDDDDDEIMNAGINDEDSEEGKKARKATNVDGSLVVSEKEEKEMERRRENRGDAINPVKEVISKEKENENEKGDEADAEEKKRKAELAVVKLGLDDPWAEYDANDATAENLILSDGSLVLGDTASTLANLMEGEGEGEGEEGSLEEAEKEEIEMKENEDDAEDEESRARIREMNELRRRLRKDELAKKKKDRVKEEEKKRELLRRKTGLYRPFEKMKQVDLPDFVQPAIKGNPLMFQLLSETYHLVTAPPTPSSSSSSSLTSSSVLSNAFQLLPPSLYSLAPTSLTPILKQANTESKSDNEEAKEEDEAQEANSASASASSSSSSEVKSEKDELFDSVWMKQKEFETENEFIEALSTELVRCKQREAEVNEKLEEKRRKQRERDRKRREREKGAEGEAERRKMIEKKKKMVASLMENMIERDGISLKEKEERRRELMEFVSKGYEKRGEASENEKGKGDENAQLDERTIEDDESREGKDGREGERTGLQEEERVVMGIEREVAMSADALAAEGGAMDDDLGADFGGLDNDDDEDDATSKRGDEREENSKVTEDGVGAKKEKDGDKRGEENMAGVSEGDNELTGGMLYGMPMSNEEEEGERSETKEMSQILRSDERNLDEIEFSEGAFDVAKRDVELFAKKHVSTFLTESEAWKNESKITKSATLWQKHITNQIDKHSKEKPFSLNNYCRDVTITLQQMKHTQEAMYAARGFPEERQETDSRKESGLLEHKILFKEVVRGDNETEVCRKLHALLHLVNKKVVKIEGSDENLCVIGLNEFEAARFGVEDIKDL
ncbi:putative Condensin II complex subunit CAP-H2 or CNDH2, C-term [Monocercomonoides exilis]|uniref:putative Condensin II complex subunit CAP-H2 or CNDH2, C-term n=1 Tax=Monocercomonoides exilis TaxID=2049356 RepID=UPI0035594212|nr:putative Condensin II complex subunit CAP-H2 or CNDH2, C-term [Monocercomonoides exilis]|eukprot:MONOS_3904.1-p1 / transcript=MONOS_3904.1 / gene=MONOS_3904 / organism=Monocercomonoides_exilis_PA203 / gene_product=unspecified product / transcript_product=unspecified product / location=Mono_scaffold00096:99795-104650(+) / protein_length=1123 / sequence_SO=supercontig / SO=protein_coding / is_pseudo=false